MKLNNTVGAQRLTLNTSKVKVDADELAALIKRLCKINEEGRNSQLEAISNTKIC